MKLDFSPCDSGSIFQCVRLDENSMTMKELLRFQHYSTVEKINDQPKDIVAVVDAKGEQV